MYTWVRNKKYCTMSISILQQCLLTIYLHIKWNPSNSPPTCWHQHSAPTTSKNDSNNKIVPIVPAKNVQFTMSCKTNYTIHVRVSPIKRKSRHSQLHCIFETKYDVQEHKKNPPIDINRHQSTSLRVQGFWSGSIYTPFITFFIHCDFFIWRYVTRLLKSTESSN